MTEQIQELTDAATRYADARQKYIDHLEAVDDEKDFTDEWAEADWKLEQEMEAAKKDLCRTALKFRVPV